MPALNVPNTFSNDPPNTNVIDADEINENNQAIEDVVNALDGDNLATATADALGVNETGTVRRGKSIIATEEARTNTAYGTLTTPDQVEDVVLPTDGLIMVAFQATWKESVNGAARAAIFLGAEQTKAAFSGVGPQLAETDCSADAGVYQVLASHPGGLSGLSDFPAVPYGGDASTGQFVGNFAGGASAAAGPAYIFAAAGTYDVSVRFKASSGTVTAKNRKLWVWTLGF